MESGNCLRCGAPYEPGDTVCYTCGAPIGETRVNTQPVRAVRVPKAEPAAEPAASQPIIRAAAVVQPPSFAPATPAPAALAPHRPRRRARWLGILAGCLLALVVLGAAAY